MFSPLFSQRNFSPPETNFLIAPKPQKESCWVAIYVPQQSTLGSKTAKVFKGWLDDENHVSQTRIVISSLKGILICRDTKISN